MGHSSTVSLAHRFASCGSIRLLRLSCRVQRGGPSVRVPVNAPLDDRVIRKQNQTSVSNVVRAKLIDKLCLHILGSDKGRELVCAASTAPPGGAETIWND